MAKRTSISSPIELSSDSESDSEINSSNLINRNANINVNVKTDTNVNTNANANIKVNNSSGSHNVKRNSIGSAITSTNASTATVDKNLQNSVRRLQDSVRRRSYGGGTGSSNSWTSASMPTPQSASASKPATANRQIKQQSNANAKTNSSTNKNNKWLLNTKNSTKTKTNSDSNSTSSKQAKPMPNYKSKNIYNPGRSKPKAPTEKQLQAQTQKQDCSMSTNFFSPSRSLDFNTSTSPDRSHSHQKATKIPDHNHFHFLMNNVQNQNTSKNNTSTATTSAANTVTNNVNATPSPSHQKKKKSPIHNLIDNINNNSRNNKSPATTNANGTTTNTNAKTTTIATTIANIASNATASTKTNTITTKPKPIYKKTPPSSPSSAASDLESLFGSPSSSSPSESPLSESLKSEKQSDLESLFGSRSSSSLEISLESSPSTRKKKSTPARSTRSRSHSRTPTDHQVGSVKSSTNKKNNKFTPTSARSAKSQSRSKSRTRIRSCKTCAPSFTTTRNTTKGVARAAIEAVEAGAAEVAIKAAEVAVEAAEVAGGTKVVERSINIAPITNTMKDRISPTAPNSSAVSKAPIVTTVPKKNDSISNSISNANIKSSSCGNNATANANSKVGSNSSSNTDIKIKTNDTTDNCSSSNSASAVTKTNKNKNLKDNTSAFIDLCSSDDDDDKDEYHNNDKNNSNKINVNTNNSESKKKSNNVISKPIAMKNDDKKDNKKAISTNSVSTNNIQPQQQQQIQQQIKKDHSQIRIQEVKRINNNNVISNNRGNSDSIHSTAINQTTIAKPTTAATIQSILPATPPITIPNLHKKIKEKESTKEMSTADDDNAPNQWVTLNDDSDESDDDDKIDFDNNDDQQHDNDQCDNKTNNDLNDNTISTSTATIVTTITPVSVPISQIVSNESKSILSNTDKENQHLVDSDNVPNQWILFNDNDDDDDDDDEEIELESEDHNLKEKQLETKDASVSAPSRWIMFNEHSDDSDSDDNNEVEKESDDSETFYDAKMTNDDEADEEKSTIDEFHDFVGGHDEIKEGDLAEVGIANTSTTTTATDRHNQKGDGKDYHHTQRSIQYRSVVNENDVDGVTTSRNSKSITMKHNSQVNIVNQRKKLKLGNGSATSSTCNDNEHASLTNINQSTSFASTKQAGLQTQLSLVSSQQIPGNEKLGTSKGELRTHSLLQLSIREKSKNLSFQSRMSPTTQHITTASTSTSTTTERTNKPLISTNKTCLTDMNYDYDEYESDAVDMVNCNINPNQDICWSCEIALNDAKGERCRGGEKVTRNNGSNKKISSNDSSKLASSCVRVFFIHQHPLLEVSTCAPCADRAYAVEDDVQKLISLQCDASQNKTENDNDEEEMHYFSRDTMEMEVCSWCANETRQKLFLCDDCPRVFCERCVAIAHGGGLKGSNAINDLHSDDGNWSCLHCKPTSNLLKMKKWLLKRDGDDRTGEYNGNEDVGNGKTPQRRKDEKSIGELLEELTIAEDMKDEAESMLEEASEQRLRDEIRREVEAKGLDEEGTKELVNHEFDTWKSLWTDQHSRSSNAIGILMDILDQRNVDLSEFYANRQPINENHEEITKEVEDEINAKLKKRDEDLGNEQYYFGAGGWNVIDDRDVDELERDELNEIEEINTTEGTIRCLTNIAKKKNQFRDILHAFREKALPKDDKILADLNVVPSNHRFTENDDEEIENQIEMNDILHEVPSSNQSGNCRVVVREYKQIQTKVKEKIRKRKLSQSNGQSNETQSNLKKPRIVTQPTSLQDNHTLLSDCNNNYSCFDNDICTLGVLPSDQNYLSRDFKKRTICIASPLARVLKEHQRNGIQFMWDKISTGIIPGSHSKDDAKIKGCVLAHSMGLGKSLQVIALIHTLLTHPLLGPKNQRKVKRVMLIAPVNTLANWENEFSIWIDQNSIPNFRVYDLSNVASSGRSYVVENWYNHGGVLFGSPQIIERMVLSGDYSKFLQEPGPDLIILDEAHQMLNKNGTHIAQALSSMRNPRRIALTGTPLQNNLAEYFTMVHWIKPGLLAKSEAEFDRIYTKRITSSLMSDSSRAEQKKGEELLAELYNKLSPYVQRLGPSVLEKDLGYMQQVVIHVRQSKIQTQLYGAFKKHCKKQGITRFLYKYNQLFSVNNHPGCLIVRMLNRQSSEDSINSNVISNTKTNESVQVEGVETHSSNGKSESGTSKHDVICMLSDSEEEDESIAVNLKESETKRAESSSDQRSKKPDIAERKEKWWESVYRRHPSMSDIQNGKKIELLMQILAHADLIGEKVVVFSLCLKTLDFIEKALQIPDWTTQVPHITNLSPGKTWGNWKKNIDYLRIDGSVSASKRGDLINQFNDGGEPGTSSPSMQEDIIRKVEDTAKVFLISTKAGNVGINLFAANRVVLFESDWNPAINEQAIYRCYRYGQKKPVYVYRLLTQGSMEEKVYSRSVHKSNLAARVIDQKDPKRNFTSNELQDITNVDTWVCCDTCDKWRMLPPHISAPEDDEWFCYMNTFDKDRSNCSAEEKDATFYAELYRSNDKPSNPDDKKEPSNDEPIDDESGEDLEKIKKTERDVILKRLLSVSGFTSTSKNCEKGKSNSTATICKYYYHDSLLKDIIKK